MDYLLKERQIPTVWWVYVANSIIALHYALILFINSAYLDIFLSYELVSLVFLTASIITIINFAILPKVISQVGVFTVTFFTVVIEILAIIGLALGLNDTSIIFSFLMHSVSISIIYFTLDIYLENATHKEETTGDVRAAYITLGNLMFVITPFIVGKIVETQGYQMVYVISTFVFIPFLFITISKLRRTKITYNKKDKIWLGIQKLKKRRNVVYSLISQLILQIFYAVMAIYLSLYLIEQTGFSWDKIGLLFTIMLVPFLIFEIPIGRLADTRFGEKEFMLVGFVIMASSLIAIVFMNGSVNFLLWAAILFASRIGASFAEITSETHFFRQIKESDSSLISLFRMTRPIAYAFVGLIGAITFGYLSFTWIWLILAMIIIAGSALILPMKDSR